MIHDAKNVLGKATTADISQLRKKGQNVDKWGKLANLFDRNLAKKSVYYFD